MKLVKINDLNFHYLRNYLFNMDFFLVLKVALSI